MTKGSQLTKDFLLAYDELKSQVLELQTENARLRATLEADDAIKRLIEKIEVLEADKEKLLSRVNQVEASRSTYLTVPELEAELSNFANLHVAANCLHSTLSLRGVGRRIREVLEQLVGVEAYVLYLCTEPTHLVPIAYEGLAAGEDPERAIGTKRLLEVVSTGAASILDDVDPSQGRLDDPPALIPLSIDDTVVGVLAVVRSLAHKRQLTTVDFELFKLLGLHGAAALMAAGLYTVSGRSLPHADAFRSLQQH
ncbi:MAG TPA: GAF domain-containing protein [Polyangiaceae bacterium]|nr:GAF domain-containing protein [Polyangiaceae bacterium]